MTYTFTNVIWFFADVPPAWQTPEEENWISKMHRTHAINERLRFDFEHFLCPGSWRSSQECTRVEKSRPLSIEISLTATQTLILICIRRWFLCKWPELVSSSPDKTCRKSSHSNRQECATFKFWKWRWNLGLSTEEILPINPINRQVFFPKKNEFADEISLRLVKDKSN